MISATMVFNASIVTMPRSSFYADCADLQSVPFLEPDGGEILLTKSVTLAEDYYFGYAPNQAALESDLEALPVSLFLKTRHGLHTNELTAEGSPRHRGLCGN